MWRIWIVSLALAAACGTDSAPAGPGPDAAGADAATTCGTTPVSFQHDVVPLIGGCGGEMCHGGLGGASWPYAALVGQPSTECDDQRLLVAPGDPAHSYLVQKLTGEGMCTGERMPRLGPPLTAAQVQTIADWICQGAANN